jgi:hypothetical protein
LDSRCSRSCRIGTRGCNRSMGQADDGSICLRRRVSKSVKRCRLVFTDRRRRQTSTVDFSPVYSRSLPRRQVAVGECTGDFAPIERAPLGTKVPKNEPELKTTRALYNPVRIPLGWMSRCSSLPELVCGLYVGASPMWFCAASAMRAKQSLPSERRPHAG